MVAPQTLEKIGLSKGESEIYLILLKIGEATTSNIAKHTKIARPNVYDYLNKLKEKGLVSFVNKNNKTYNIPSSPEKLLEYLDEKVDLLKNNMNSLLEFYKPKKEAPHVEIYESAEGFKNLINDILKTKSEIVGWGASSKVKEYVPDHLVERYVRMKQKLRIKGRFLYVKKEGVLDNPITKFKSIPEEYASPATTLVYGDKIAIMVYTAIPLIMIIKSKELAESYRKHFELLWNKVR